MMGRAGLRCLALAAIAALPSIASLQAILALVGTPCPIVDCLYRGTAKALRLPDAIERLPTQGGNGSVGSTPDEFAKLIKANLAAWA